ncbi:MAG TPA: hypothetical protein VEC19_18235 [Usitatibacter sp.]|nr:hypothetical protein [Usitatibacter sp.]
MKRLPFAAAILTSCAVTAMAQAPSNVPEQKCEPKPVYPGMKHFKSDVEVKAFEGQIKSYKECIMGYISERKNAARAHEQAANSAADEHNKVMEKIRTDQEAQRAELEKARASEKKDNVSTPGVKPKTY